MSVTDNVIELLEPVVATLGVELVDVEFNGGLLRVTVDQEGGITTDVLTKVNRNISPILDQHDPIPGRYTLEVSSPGVERRLNTLAHYRRAIGENVILKLFPGQEQRRIRGELVAVDDTAAGAAHDSVTVDAVETDGVDLAEVARFEIALTDVSKARTVFDWGPAPKPGKSPSKKKPDKKKTEE